MDIRCAHTELIDIDLIQPNPRNPNKHPDAQIKLLAKIMAHQGWRSPVVISKRSGFVVKGHGRLMAAKLNGWAKAPVDKQDYATEADEYSDMVADNKIAELAETDMGLVYEDVSILGPDFDTDLLGIPDFVMPEVLEPQCDEDEVPDKVEPRTKLGDLYRLGRHRLLCGDSTNIQHVERLMGKDRADLVFTDPPYGVDYDGGHANKNRREKLANDDSTTIYDNSVPMMFAFSKDNSALYLWFAATKSLQVLQVLQVLQENNYEIRSWLIWNKNMAQFGAIGAQYKQKHEPCLYAYKKGKSPFWDGPNNEVSVWDIKRASVNEFHPTQKPVELAERAIANSCPKSGLVLDLFGCSGATMIAAEKAQRRANLMELSPSYCDVIVARWEKYTGKKAEIING